MDQSGVMVDYNLREFQGIRQTFFRKQGLGYIEGFFRIRIHPEIIDGVEQGVFVIALDGDDLQPDQFLRHFIRIRTVTDIVPQGDYVGNPLGPDIRKNRVKGGKVAVNI